MLDRVGPCWIDGVPCWQSVLALRVESLRSVLNRSCPCRIRSMLDRRNPCWCLSGPCLDEPVRAVLCCRVLAVRAVSRTSLLVGRFGLQQESGT